MRFLCDRGQLSDMATDGPMDETTVNDRYAVTIPAAVRDQLDIDSGDRVRWQVTSDGDLSVEVIRERTGAFEDYEPIDMGPTDAASDHDAVGVDHPE